MQDKAGKKAGVILIFLLSLLKVSAQISPGVLSNAHSHLEGISNCTQCHLLGNKVSNDKCLICHTEIETRINLQKGYHSSVEVKGKQCSVCHSEHNGKNFQLIRLDLKNFNHNLTGFSLFAPHIKQECNECHNAKNFTDQIFINRKNTYLGLKPECLTCHADYHLRTLSSSCLNCHNPESFTPASNFNHNTARFQLAGKHKKVDCNKCHKVEMIEGKKFQHFRGIQYINCTSCHKDPHLNKFGQNCRQCHSEESFQIVSGIRNFDHNKTDFKLEEKHLIVNCRSCHKTKFTDPLKHDRCTDCHADYHNNQFSKNNITPDCSECHTVKGFAQFLFTVEKHNLSRFPLQAAHRAIPCYECHKKQEKWSFREIGINCKDCHADIHQNIIPARYYPAGSCITCHSETRWEEVIFDHSKTEFVLSGAHTGQKCRTCHFKKDSDGFVRQKFEGLSKNCSSCHSDNHFRQFERNGMTDCNECHTTENWELSKFDHNNTSFKLDGKHINVECKKCHRTQQEGSKTYVIYKLKEFKCESCHF
jgi:hypothetical protein